MGIFGKKQQVSPENIEKSGKTPPSKEEKKDTSIFGGKSFLRREKFRGWLEKDEAYRVTKMSRNERVGLGKKIFDPKRFGGLIEPKEAKRVHDELKNFPTRSRKKYGIESEGERFKMLNLLKEKFLGK